MAKVVVTTGEVSCPHQGTARLTAVPAKSELVIDTAAVLTTSSIGAVTFAGCTNPPEAGGPCTQIVRWTGASTMLEVGGEAAILDTSVPITDRAPTTGSVKLGGQDRLEADG